jgi:hypothetical protein
MGRRSGFGVRELGQSQAGENAVEQSADSSVDVVPDGLDAICVGLGWISNRPILVPSARDERASIAAAHRDDYIGGGDYFVGERLGELFVEADPPLLSWRG